MAAEEMRVDGAQRRYRIASVEPDARRRTRLQVAADLDPGAAFETLDELAGWITSGEPAVVVFGPSLANDTGLAHAQRVTRAHPEVGVVLVVDELSTELLQHALRSGVRDVVTVDADDAALGQAVARVGDAVLALCEREPADTAPRLGRVVAAFSTKGGVGKSVVATNLATLLATRAPGRVALVDADLQFGDVAVLLGVPPRHTTIDAAEALDGADEELLEGLLAAHDPTGLRVLPAPVEPAAADRISPEQMLGIVTILQGMHDFVVIDMPPHFDDVVVALLEAADDVLLVASMDVPSIKNLKVGMQTLDLLSLAGDKMQLVLNRANAKVNLEVADVERAIGVPARFRVPSDISVPQAVNRGVPVVLDRPRSAAALALGEVADWFLGADAAPAPDRDPRRFWRRDQEAR